MTGVTRKETSTFGPPETSNVPGWTVESLQERFGVGLTIDRKLGEGAMGAVFLAHDGGRTYALKVLLPTALGSTDTLRRFILEGKLLLELDHPNILKVHEVGEDPTFPYLLCDFIEGSSLDALIEKEAPYNWGRALDITTQVLMGLKEAHAHKVIHRDIKPSNVLVDGEGRCRLADFGIAKADRADAQRTSTGIVMGTPAYMAPELVLGARATEAADVYAVGTMLFELLVGKPPFPDDDVTQMFTAKIKSHAPRLSDVVTGLPRPLDRLISMSIARDIEERIPSAAAFLREVEDTRKSIGQVKPSQTATRAVSTADFVALKPAAKTQVEGEPVAGVGRPRVRTGASGRIPVPPPAPEPAAWKPIAAGLAIVLGLTAAVIGVRSMRANRDRSPAVRTTRANEGEAIEPLTSEEIDLARGYSMREEYLKAPDTVPMPRGMPVRATMILRQAMKSANSASLKSLLARKAGETGEAIAVDGLVETLSLSVPQDEHQKAAKMILNIIEKAGPPPRSFELFDRSSMQMHLCNILTTTANGGSEDALVIEAAVVTLGWLAPPSLDADCLRNMAPAATHAAWVSGPGHGDPVRTMKKTLEAIGTEAAKAALKELEH